MAIYHFSVQVIGRSSGRSAVAAAAYRSASKLINNYDGVAHDYTKKNWVTYTEIMLPAHAPEEYKDRSVLWNSVESIEKSSKARLCREVEVALPVELCEADNISLLTSFVQDVFVDQGMIADIAVHNPPVRDDLSRPVDRDGNSTYDRSKMIFNNPHAHVLLSLRSLDKDGKWEPKSKIQYLCKKNGVEKPLTADQFQLKKVEGWEKQYKYFTPDGKKMWYTPSEAGKLQLERVNFTPKTTPFGLANPITEYWNDRARIPEWREKWAEYVNRELMKHGIDSRVNERSFIDQGREFELPTIHLGPSAAAIERRAGRENAAGVADVIHSDIAEINAEIRKHNQFVRELQQQLDKEIEKIQQDDSKQEERLIRIRDLQQTLQDALSRRDALEQQRNRITGDIRNKELYVQEFRSEISKLQEAINTKTEKISELEAELNSTKSKKQRNMIKKEITVERETLDTLQGYLTSQKSRYGIEGEGNFPGEDEILNMKAEADQLVEQIAKESEMIEDTSDLIETLAQGHEIGSETFTLATQGTIEVVRQYKTQQKKAETRRRR